MDFDTRIFEAVEGGTLEKPHDLVQILANADSREKLVLSHEELSGGFPVGGSLWWRGSVLGRKTP